MRKLMAVLGIVFFTSVLALPVFARGGPGMGRGYGMMGSWGQNSAYCDQGGRYYQEPNQNYRGEYNQQPEAQSAPNDRSSRGYYGGPKSYERGADRYGNYGNYGHMGGFGMGWSR
jgi:hypothetical protein